MSEQIDRPHIIRIPTFTDARGSLSVTGKGSGLPFSIGRAYWIYGVAPGMIRGAHAHLTQSKLLVAVSGSFSVDIDDGRSVSNFRLNQPDEGILIPPLHWLSLHSFSEGSVCLALSADEYDESDYIRDHGEFLKLIGK